jgi:hypothetical protein
MSEPTEADYAAVDEFWADGDFTGFDRQDRVNFARWRASARAEKRAEFARLALSPEMVRKITWGCPPHIGFGATLAVLESLFRETGVSP